jgi:hypothetical protein
LAARLQFLPIYGNTVIKLPLTDDAMKDKDAKKRTDAVGRRYPEALTQELSSAFFSAERVIPNPDERQEMFSRFRRNQVRYIAAWGLEPNGQSVSGLESIPVEYVSVLHDLDRALAKLQQYSLHPEDYASKKVAAVIDGALQSQRASKPRKRTKDSREEIARYLEKRGIHGVAYGVQKGIVQDAMEHFDVSQSTVRRVIREFGLGVNATK